MRKYLVTILLLSSLGAFGQDVSVDNLRQLLLLAKEDTAKIQLLKELGYSYLGTKPDSSLALYRQGLSLARKKKLLRWEAVMTARVSYALGYLPGREDSAKAYMQRAMDLCRLNSFYGEQAWCYTTLSRLYFLNWHKPDTAIGIINEGIEFAEKNNLWDDQANMRINLANYYIESGKTNQRKAEASFLIYEGGWYLQSLNYSEALKSLLAAIKILEVVHEERELARALNSIGQIYYDLGEYRHSLSYYLQGIALGEKLQTPFRMLTYQRIGSNYAKLKMHDSAVYFAKKSYAEAEHDSVGPQFPYILDDIAETYVEVDEDSIAMLYFRRCLLKFLPTDPLIAVNKAEIFVGIAKLFKKAGQSDSAFFYASLSLPLAQHELPKSFEKVHVTGFIYDASTIIANYYHSKHRWDSAFVYLQTATLAKDSLFNQKKLSSLRNTEFNEQLRQQQAKEEAIKYRNRITTYFFIAGIAAVLLIAIFLYRNIRVKQNANLVLKEQKQKVEGTLEQLRSTQAQLIQSEKMASLGELTAGIAHEIQNPLNFVNNFSDVNTELIDELKKELATGNMQSANEIADNLKDNEQKINHHGKRAETIVKGMLQHSGTSSGHKEATDVNALCDEYLRLAYHGLRAKDKSFNARLETDFDPSMSNINIVPQEIGRVILNLINNAFYTVNEKQKRSNGKFEPTVSVSTKRMGNKVAIVVADNGNGIPEKNLDKIFQPFFTTKPTGEGTGLGLSLAYDIITKGHNGEMKVETKEGEGSKFIVIIPFT